MSLPDFLQTDPPPVNSPSTDRLRALYASTSTQRSTNPTGYEVNSTWWQGAIEETLRSGWINDGEDRLVLKVEEALLGRFDWSGSRPKGLGGVVEGLANTSPPILHPTAHFLSSQAPLHQNPSIASRFIGRPLWWALGQLNPFHSNEPESEAVLWKRYKGEYVHMPLLEQSAAAYSAYIRKHPPLTYTDSLYDIPSFASAFAAVAFPSSSKKLPHRPKGHKLSKKDVDILIRWLSRDCGLVVTDGEVVKVLEEGTTTGEISDADRGTVAVLSTLRKIDDQVASLEKEIEACQEKAKIHLSNKQKSLALAKLRSKKNLEEVLEKRLASGEQLRTVIRSIDQAKSDVQIIAAYETSTATLRGILTNPALSLEKVEQTTEALAEALADQKEIDDAIAVGGQVAVKAAGVEDVDEADLELELAEMVKEHQEAEEAIRLAQAKAKAELEAKEAAREALRARPAVAEDHAVSPNEHPPTESTSLRHEDLRRADNGLQPDEEPQPHAGERSKEASPLLAE